MLPHADPSPPAATLTDPAAFLREHAATQGPNVQSYRLPGAQWWLKRAGASHGPGRYRAMAVLARLLGLAVLRPVPTPGGPAAIAIEVERLRDFAARGLRAPEVLAVQQDAFLMRHLGRPDEETHSLGNEIDHAVAEGPEAVLALWRQGLDAIAQVHASGTCLSQAFARNLVRCPDGVVGYVDFEDDPATALPLPVCHARDALCYVQSTALYLRQAGALESARTLWAAWLSARGPEARAVLATTVRRLAWLRHLPQSRRLGRDLQRVRAAYDLLAP
ncbi:hypothetical protein [Paracidovorax valerianellae]|uniref:RIO1 family protein n=1 Tax=Paracidovorax valerianellae TaxID=187868 RepID=A0A1G7AWN2_9BURK|nr:hypothetical protein [Paracidovorax valerianellae]MDA8445633.1 hypothetical protein [Paracidovorax valerianellae]SDE19288.1 hypothetical protein SAMN05192589_11390 [Paracidovorax valerianellae]